MWRVEPVPERESLAVYTAPADRKNATLSRLAMQAVFRLPKPKISHRKVLQQQLEVVSERMGEISTQLSQLAETDKELYRTLLQTDPISEDLRQVGVGGTDRYVAFESFSASTLLKQTSEQLDQLERQVGLQNSSYRELRDLASEHESRLMQMPAILPADGPVVSGFGMRNHPILGYARMHKGIDILLERGSPINSPGDGVVEETGVSSSFGKYIKVRHPMAGYRTVYAHLSKVNVRKGQRVERGDLLGLSGNSGLSKAPHLHYEVHDLDGVARNPIFFFAPSMTPQRYQALLAQAERSGASFD